MRIISKVGKTIQKSVRKCYVNSLARMESVCVLRERLMSILYVQYLVDLAMELAVTFPQNFEKVVSVCSVVPMLCFKVFSDG